MLVQYFPPTSFSTSTRMPLRAATAIAAAAAAADDDDDDAEPEWFTDTDV